MFKTESSFAQSPDLVRVRFWKRPGVCAPANMGRNAARSLLWALMCIAALPELETRSRSVPDLALEPKFSSRVSDLAPVPFHAVFSWFSLSLSCCFCIPLIVSSIYGVKIEYLSIALPVFVLCVLYAA